jgi:shikimate dehydrogenase
VTAVYGLIGHPVSHSRSPAMHNAAFRASGVDAVYGTFDVPPERLPVAIASLRTLGVAGANVTVPHKTTVGAYLDALDAVARSLGAVNTIVRQEDGRLLGTNTDAEGLSRALAGAGAELRGAHVVVLGSGGAARAAVVGLSRAGASEVVVVARREPAAWAVVASVRGACAATRLHAVPLGPSARLRAVFAAADVLVQATPATMDPASAGPFMAALPIGALRPDVWVTDLVYAPRDTALLVAARERGARTVDGLGMLLHQGALAFERWTGRPAPVAVMRDALMAEYAGPSSTSA